MKGLKTTIGLLAALAVLALPSVADAHFQWFSGEIVPCYCAALNPTNLGLIPIPAKENKESTASWTTGSDPSPSQFTSYTPVEQTILVYQWEGPATDVKHLPAFTYSTPYGIHVKTPTPGIYRFSVMLTVHVESHPVPGEQAQAPYDAYVEVASGLVTVP